MGGMERFNRSAVARHRNPVVLMDQLLTGYGSCPSQLKGRLRHSHLRR